MFTRVKSLQISSTFFRKNSITYIQVFFVSFFFKESNKFFKGEFAIIVGVDQVKNSIREITQWASFLVVCDVQVELFVMLE